MNNIVMRSSEAQNTRIILLSYKFDNYYIGKLYILYVCIYMTSTNGEIYIIIIIIINVHLETLYIVQLYHSVYKK